MKYDKVVSLGNACQTAYQIRRLLPYQQEAYPFDWLITPHRALIATLQENFSGFLDPKNLIARPKHDGYLIEDQVYGFELHHDFHGNLANWRQELPEVVGKYQALQTRWHSLLRSQAHILFIRMNALGDISTSEMQELMFTLAGQKIAATYEVLFLHLNRDKEVDIKEDQFRRLSLLQPTPWVWSGDDTEWNRLAERIGVT